eukprot:snap_masked-scaffold_31-processed-gene-1.27-mRNA-1 protein AED:0.26 eAED:0.26 QI:0/-1/0/1/-1/1/1/0/213
MDDPDIIMRGHKRKKSIESDSSTLSPFLRKLSSMLEAETEVISWDQDGKSVLVHDDELFKTKVLPNFFRGTNNVNSFIRQLHFYSFTKTHFKRENGKVSWRFSHTNFIRDKPHLMQLITRQKVRPVKSYVSREEFEILKDLVTKQSEEIITLRNEIRILRQGTSVVPPPRRVNNFNILRNEQGDTSNNNSTCSANWPDVDLKELEYFRPKSSS